MITPRSVVLTTTFLLLGCGGAPPQQRTAQAPTEATLGAPVAKQRVTSALSAEGLKFESGTVELREGADTNLDALAAAIGRGAEGATAHIRVTVDPDPRACSGTSLAQLRAQALGEALVARGVPSGRIAAVGVGPPPEGCTSVSASRSSVSIELED
jgi:outer membrane protein OmpA-like peptidoglycan-associated protein